MAGRIKRRRLHSAVEAVRISQGCSFGEAVILITKKSGYTDRTKLYSYIRGDRSPRLAGAKRIVKTLNELANPATPYTLDLFGEG